MSNSEFPNVGVNFVANNAQAYTQAVNGAASVTSTAKTNVQTLGDAMLKQGFSVNEARDALRSYGFTVAEVNSALGPLEARVKSSGNSVMQNARGGRDALFAFGLALNLVISELGTNLPPAAKQAASGIKIVADSMLAGAYIAGAQGAAAGALIGVLTTLFAVSLALDPAIKALNDDLDKLGKKDDPAVGLSKLAGVTENAAQNALDYAKANAEEADSLNRLARAAEDASVMVGKYNELIAGGMTPLQARQTVEYMYGRALTDVMIAAQDTLRAEVLLDAHRKQVADMSDRAGTLGTSILDLGESSRENSETATEQHYMRLGDITANGEERRAEIVAQYATRLKEIEEQRIASEEAALASYNQSVSDAEANASDRRVSLASELSIALSDAEEQASQGRQNAVDAYNEKIETNAQQRAERLLQIEIAYQNAIRNIQDTYNLSRFNAIANQDARALVQANMAREVALRKENETHQQQLDAVERQRVKDADAAKEAYEKAQRTLSDALARQEEKLRDNYEKQMRAQDEALRKQENKLREEYDKRIAALETAAAKQRDAASDTQSKEFIAQEKAQTAAEKSEAKSWALRNAEIDRALAKGEQAIATSLLNVKGMTEANGLFIIDSLRNILSPDQFARIVQDFMRSAQAKIEIKVTPFADVNTRGLTEYAEGGYIGMGGPAVLHSDEVVLPLSNQPRTQELMQQYVMPRMSQSMPGNMMGGGGSGTLMVRIALDSAMLNANVVQQTEQLMVNVISQVEQQLARGV